MIYTERGKGKDPRYQMLLHKSNADKEINVQLQRTAPCPWLSIPSILDWKDVQQDDESVAFQGDRRAGGTNRRAFASANRRNRSYPSTRLFAQECGKGVN